MNTRAIKILPQNENSTWCDGGSGSLGHPKINLLFAGKRHVDCYYCGQRFAKTGYSEKSQQSIG